MALEPITRQEKIIAGENLTPITRMEMFLKNFGGGGGVGGGRVPTLHITVTSLDMSTMETTITADKTPDEMYAVSGPTWCIVTVPESISPTGHELVFECSSYKCGYSFGYGLVFNKDLTGGIDFAVYNSDDSWVLQFKYLL